MKIGAIIQARMGSTRLPGKVLADICGKPALQRVIERVQAVKGLDTIVVAQPAAAYSQEISRVAAKCRLEELSLAAVQEDDVLSRYTYTATKLQLDVVMRITADCPLLDPTICEQVLLEYLISAIKRLPYDYVSNTQPPTFPDGLDCEVFSFEALESAHQKATSSYDREHVTPYLYKLGSRFKKATLFNVRDESHHRWTLDTQSDLEWIRSIYSILGDGIFGKDEIMELLAERPELARTLPR